MIADNGTLLQAATIGATLEFIGEARKSGLLQAA